MLVELQFEPSQSATLDRDWLKVYGRQVVNLQHPTLLRVFDVCLDEQDRWVLVRQSLPGVWRWLYDRTIRRTEVETITSILLSVSEALSYLHHADFRGTNFSAWHESARIVESANGEFHFGMTPPTPLEAHQTSETGYLGVPAYSAPEALAFTLGPKEFVYHPPTPASDSFSLGSLLFELLTGEKLASAPSVDDAIRQMASGQFPAPRDIRPDLPAQLSDFVSRALAKSPEARPSLREWGFTMEKFGGRLLMPSTSSEESPVSGKASEGTVPNLVSVLKDEPGNQRITILGAVGSGGAAGEYFAEISIDEPETKEQAPAETFSAGPPDEDEIPTQPLSPQALGTRVLSAPSISDDAFSASPSVSTGALPADFVAEPDTPIYLDENVQFTVYRPKAIVPQKWYSLLAFAHLSEKREDAPEDEPDPVAEVRQQAQRILGEQTAEYQKLTQDTLQAIPREGTITFLPTMPGVEFNPPSRSFTWEESVHREDFRLRAKQSGHGGRVLKGRLSVFLGSILLADIPLSIRVDTHEASKKQKKVLEEVHARPYRKIFASYSHRDMEVVEQFERFAEALGDRYLRDVTYLRSGEIWNDKLEEMIVEADIFQLFWSSNSMTSPFVRQEWEYALSLQRPNFIRPTYWEEPLPVKPDQKLPPEELMRLHFQRIRSGYDSRSRAPSPAQEVTPIAAAPEDTEVTQTAVRASQSSGRAQSIERRAGSRDSAQSEAPPALRRRSASRSAIEREELISETPDAPKPPRPPLTVSERFYPPATQPRGVGASGERIIGSGGRGLSRRQGVGGLGPSDPPRTIPSYRPPAAAAPPEYSSSHERAGRSGSGERLDFGYEPQSRSLAPILILIALVLLTLIGGVLYFLLR
jgi:serine/threonine protein kinase